MLVKIVFTANRGVPKRRPPFDSFFSSFSEFVTSYNDDVGNVSAKKKKKNAFKLLLSWHTGQDRCRQASGRFVIDFLFFVLLTVSFVCFFALTCKRGRERGQHERQYDGRTGVGFRHCTGQHVHADA